MAQLTPAAELIAGLKADGWNNEQIGKALGINRSLVRQAVSPSPGQRQKPLTKYIPALTQLQGQKPGAKPSALPAPRATKAGTTANVRHAPKQITTKSGQQHSIARVKNGPATLRKQIEKAAKSGKELKWDVNFKNMKTTSDMKKKNAWATGKLPKGWDAQKLLDRIDNPKSGDTWRSGDVNGALASLAMQQQTGVVSATGPREFSLFTVG